MKYLITGGTGFIGSHLVDFLTRQKNDITILTRNPKKIPSGCKAITDISSISDDQKFDVIINLAGANVSRRWTESYKKNLISSRLKVTQGLVDLVSRLKEKPLVFISASAIGYYGDQKQGIIIDESTKGSNGFTHELCSQWEECANQIKKYNVRTCIARLGVVLGKEDGALKKMLPSFYLGLGGKMSDGKQILSWIHIEDVIRAFDYMIKNGVDGVFNVTAPNPISNKHFTEALGTTLKRPTFFTVPAVVVKTIFGEMGKTLLLKGSAVFPKRLQENNFTFKFKTIESALKSLLKG